ncbi:hypothetical protein HNR10_005379 [Nocardiopsis aegyptia]|uniref:Uncharacterized protein n=1 Tax=Nocardiopsis aegyptia TaxID=220378 RepID=A0A7Z0EUE7_9ACTN|nr:hypothetical protein [Nocardiopsis aegyptia]
MLPVYQESWSGIVASGFTSTPPVCPVSSPNTPCVPRAVDFLGSPTPVTVRRVRLLGLGGARSGAPARNAGGSARWRAYRRTPLGRPATALAHSDCSRAPIGLHSPPLRTPRVAESPRHLQRPASARALRPHPHATGRLVNSPCSAVSRLAYPARPASSVRTPTLLVGSSKGARYLRPTLPLLAPHPAHLPEVGVRLWAVSCPGWAEPSPGGHYACSANGEGARPLTPSSPLRPPGGGSGGTHPGEVPKV